MKGIIIIYTVDNSLLLGGFAHITFNKNIKDQCFMKLLNQRIDELD